MAIIPHFFNEAVVALGIGEQKVWIATGFLVGKWEGDTASVFLVTNKHVVNGKTRLWVRFNSQSQGVVDLPLSLVVNEKKIYIEHPDPSVDIVVIKINAGVAVNQNVVLQYFDIDKHCLTLEKMKETGVEEGTIVYTLGFPMNLVGNNLIKAPVCRMGCISQISNLYSKEPINTSFLVDAQTFPGNSGGPVVSRPEQLSITGTPSNSSANLIGILSAYIPYNEPLVSKQTGNIVEIRQENSGLTVVFPVDRIIETVNICIKKDIEASAVVENH